MDTNRSRSGDMGFKMASQLGATRNPGKSPQMAIGVVVVVAIEVVVVKVVGILALSVFLLQQFVVVVVVVIIG